MRGREGSSTVTLVESFIYESLLTLLTISNTYYLDRSIGPLRCRDIFFEDHCNDKGKKQKIYLSFNIRNNNICDIRSKRS